MKIYLSKHYQTHQVKFVALKNQILVFLVAYLCKKHESFEVISKRHLTSSPEFIFYQLNMFVYDNIQRFFIHFNVSYFDFKCQIST